MKGDERVQTVEECADSALLWQRWNENFLLKKILYTNSFIIVPLFVEFTRIGRITFSL